MSNRVAFLIYFLGSLLTSNGQLSADDADSVGEISWTLRQLTATSAVRREIAILMLPCLPLLVDGHLEHFLVKLLQHADVDYDLTRVSIWIGEEVVEDQIQDKDPYNNFCTLTRSLERTLSRQPTVSPFFNADNLLHMIQDILMPYGPYNPSDKYLLVFHCGLQLKLPDRLAMLEKHGSVITVALPQDGHARSPPPSIHERLGNQRRRQRYRGRLSGRYRPMRNRPRPPPQFAATVKPEESQKLFLVLSHAAQLEQISSKAFYADLQGPLYSVGRCRCIHEFTQCVCDRQSGRQTCMCAPGHYMVRSQRCQQCPPNTYGKWYSDTGHATTCRPCPDMDHVSPQGSSKLSQCVCKPGYVPTAGNSCAQVECPQLSAPSYGILVGGLCDTTMNAACGFRCDSGYELTGSSVRVCGIDGDWSGVEPKCLMKKCQELSAPQYGNIQCSTDDFRFGTLCQFSCNAGYTVLGSRERSCLSVGHWSGIDTYCQTVTCARLPGVLNGYLEPSECSQSEQRYGVICSITCRQGYQLVGPSLKQCSNRGVWTYSDTEWACIDTEAPIVECPANITTQADQVEYMTEVPSIPPPNVQDSSLILSVVQIPAQLFASFPLGHHRITYEVKDVWNNTGYCEFFVNVIDITLPVIESCVPPAPVMSKLYAKVDIPAPVFSDNSLAQTVSSSSEREGFSVTASRPFSLSWKYGITPVNVTASDSSLNNVTCSFNVTVLELRQICERFADLSSGFFSCSPTNNTYAVCQRSCTGLRLSAFLPSNEEIVCTKEEITPSFVSDCSDAVTPNYKLSTWSEAKIKYTCGDYSYISSLIDAVDSQMSKHLQSLCSNELMCESSLNTHNCAFNGSSSNIALEFNISVQPNRLGLHSEPFLKDMLHFLQAFLSDGLFVGHNLPDGLLADLCFNITRQEMGCQKGHVLIDTHCYACPRGTFYASSHNCESCPPGYYQDTPASGQCIQCPVGTTTYSPGTKYKHRCFRMCGVGTYSPSGLDDPRSPCRTCERGYYQPRKGKTRCIRCYRRYSTLHRGTSTASQCKALCIGGYVSRTGLAPCVPCPRDSYQPDMGSTSCLLCPNGLSTLESGSDHISKCGVFEGDPNQEEEPKIRYSLPANKVLPYSECFHQPCLQDSACHSLALGFYCDCQLGFTGTFCEVEVDECHSSPCLNGGKCMNLINRYQCTCPSGWTGARCETEVQECLSAPCLNGGSCVDRIGGYNCLCKIGFTGAECEADIDECSLSSCLHSSTCINLIGGFECVCVSGYSGSMCDIDVNECLSSPCQHGASCLNTAGSFRCQCLAGFAGALCDININECLPEPCQNGATCQDLDNGFLCTCQSGYGGHTCDRELTSDYVLRFGGDGSYSQAELSDNMSVFNSLSVSLWLKTADKNNAGTPFSYANYEYDNAFTLSDYTGLKFHVNNEVRWTGEAVNDGQWHHLAVTWSSSGGVWQLFIDGLLTDAGSSLSTDRFISGGGRFLIAQEQDGPNEPFSHVESYIGQVTLLHVWSYALLSREILAMHTSCKDLGGDVVDWPQFRFTLVGSVKVENSSFCTDCDTPSQLTNGSVNWSEVQTGGVAVYNCDDGYRLEGRSKRFCTVTGEWTHIPPSCTVVDCGPPPQFQEQLNMTYGGSLYSNRTRYYCNQGYSGYGEFVCSASGDWVGTAPTCLRVVCSWPNITYPLAYIHTKNASGIAAASMGVSTSNVFYPGESFSLTCQVGYVLVGASDLRCDSNGTWETTLPYCQKISECMTNPPRIEGATFTTDNSTGSLVAEYKCSVGWDAVGNSTLQCLGEHWLDLDFACVKRKCEQPVIAHSIIVSDSHSLSGYEYGDSINVSCLLGYYREGKGHMFCNEAGNWSNDYPSCEPVPCDAPSDVDFRRISFNSHRLVYGTEARFSCLPGYQIYGSSKLTCLETGRWSDAFPLCQRITCCQQPTVSDAKAIVSSYFYQGLATYFCNEGFTMVGNNSVECDADGNWTEIKFVCTEVSCGPPPTAANSQLEASKYTYNSTASSVCLPGYVIAGNLINQQTTCTANATWSPSYLLPCVKVQCPQRLSLEHGIVGGSDSVYYEETQDYNCNEGYTLSGADNSTCLIDGSWSDDLPVCVQVLCSTPDDLANRRVTYSGVQFNSTVVYSCHTGYYLLGEIKLTCLASGLWSYPPPSCEPVSCEELSFLENGYTSSNGTFYNCSAEFWCKQGFRLIGQTRIFCGEDGLWSDTPPSCERIQCSVPLFTLPYGVISYANIFAGSKASIVCDPGYFIQYDELVCIDNGSWVCGTEANRRECSNMSCAPIECPLPATDNQTIANHSAGITYNSTMLYSCAHGYRLEGAASRTCQIDGSWSDADPSCHMITCSPPVVGDNTVQVLHYVTYLFGDVVSFMCEKGYNLVGASNVTCTVDEQWNASVPQCVPVTCSRPQEPFHGSLVVTNSTYLGRVTYTCTTGYELNGTSVQICMEDGEWSGVAPSCLLINCSEPAAVVNGRVAYDSLTYGSILTFSCMNGYLLEGDNHSWCTANASWSNPPPHCNIVVCPQLSVDDNVRISGSNTYGSKAIYSCTPGYRLVGREDNFCQSDGSWLYSDSPVCKLRECPPPPLLVNGNWQRVDNSISSLQTNLSVRYYIGTQLTSSCAEGYVLSPSAAVIECLDIQQWDAISLPTCEPISCPEISVINGLASSNSTSYNSSVDVTCAPGYTLHVNESQLTVYCTSRGVWHPPIPQCNAVSCGEPMDVKHGRYWMNGSTYKSVVEYTCDYGYRLEGDKSMTCTATGFWTPDGSVPRCKLVMCGEPEEPFHGSVEVTNLRYLSEVVYTCTSGYELNGTSVQICMEDGEWSGVAPSCLPINCSEPAAVVNGRVDYDSLTYGSILTFSCMNGYLLNGDNHSWCTANASWSNPPPQCNIVVCPQLSVDGNVRISGSNTYGSKAIYSCTPGYQLVGREDNFCQSDGSWLYSDSPVCKLRECPPPPLLVNGNWQWVNNSISSLQTNSSVRYYIGTRLTSSCSEGYVLSPSAAVIECLDIQQWDAISLPTCESISCPEISVINGLASSNSTSYNSSVDVTCAPGYTLHVNESQLTAYCTPRGVWHPPIPQCNAVSCGEPMDVKHGRYWMNGSTYKSVVEYTCDYGYRLEGDKSMICTAAGSWTPDGSVPRCELVMCGEPKKPLHGTVEVTNLTYLSEVVYSCTSGYELNGTSVQTCMEDGEWSGVAPSCLPINCSEPAAVVNGRVDYDSLTYGSILTFSCMNGYLLEGDNHSWCTANASWSNPPPQCNIVVCPQLSVDDNVRISGSNTYGSRAIYSCTPDYQLVGREDNFCQSDGSWLYSDSPVCKLRKCPPPPLLVNGNWQWVDNSINSLQTNSSVRYYIGTRLTPSCAEGYVLSPSAAVIECLDIQQWDDISLPTCEPISCPQISVINGLASSNSTSYNSSVDVTCAPGYTLHVNESQLTVYCTSRGVWHPPIPQCNAVSCGEPMDIKHGRYWMNGSTYKSVVEYTCDYGYRLEGDKSKTCTAAGSWTPDGSVSCIYTTCPHPGPLDNGRLYGREAQAMQVGESIIVMCNLGYKLNGALVNRCQMDGRWSSGVPRCHPVNCSALASIPHGRALVNSFMYNSVATYLCDPGFTMQGRSERKCLSNRKWSGEEPSCIAEPCGSPPNILHANITFPLRTFYPGDSVEYRCLEGFELQGNAVVHCGNDSVWPDTLPSCVKACPPPSLADSQVMSSSQPKPYLAGDIVTLTCADNSSSIKEVNATCQSDGTWAGLPDQPYCEEIVCSISPYLISSQTPTVGVYVTFTCTSGYRLVGAEASTCLVGGVWEDPLPDCVIIDCGPPETVPYGNVQYNSTLYSSTASYSCNLGYNLNGMEILTCTDNSSWAPSTPACLPIMCSVDTLPMVTNGRMVYNYTEYKSTAFLTCDLGYMVEGTEATVCTVQGLWEPQVGNCTARGCSEPPQVMNGELFSLKQDVYKNGDVVRYRCLDASDGALYPVTCSGNSTWVGVEDINCDSKYCQLADTLQHTRLQVDAAPSGFTVLFECDTGYTLDGAEFVHCDGTEWSAPVPTCLPSLCTFNQPLAIAHGSFLVTQFNLTAYKAEYACDKGYEIAGNSVTYCDQSVGWEETTPSCTPLACPTIRLTEGLMLLSNGSQPFIIGVVISLRCTPEYKLVGAAKLTCGSNGSWSDEVPYCVAKHCVETSLQPPLAGYLEYTGYSQGSVANLKCYDGYVVQGHTKVTCQEDGSWSTLNGSCIAIECDRLVLGDRMFISEGHSERYTYNHTVQLKCHRGYKLEPAIAARVQCGPSGAWTPSLPRCIEQNECEPPVSPIYKANAKDPQLTYYQGDWATFECQAGYWGLAQLRCLETATWLEMSACKRVSCGQPITDGIAIMHTKTFTYGSYLAFTCPSGYRRVGPAFLFCLQTGQWSSAARCRQP